MNHSDLNRLEREVEVARARLSRDLFTLRSPTAAGDFSETVKQEVLDRAKTGMQSVLHNIIEDIKERAIANPAAALAIGAGLAWRLVRYPPIATALVGVGLLSLFRTAPARVHGRATSDYLSYAGTRLMEQATDVAEMAKSQAATVGEAVAEKVSETAGAAKGRIEEWASQIAPSTRRDTISTEEFDETAWSAIYEPIEEIGRDVRALRARTADWVEDNPQIKDNLLLGVAGAAVVAALAIAAQRRIAAPGS